VAGDKASLLDPALDRILDFAGQVGLVAIIHNDMDAPFAKHVEGTPPIYYEQMKSVLRRHPKTTMIWAHTGLGRVVRPFGGHAKLLEEILKDPAYRHVYFDISWQEVAKYIVESPESLKISAVLLNRYPDRFLFGTDEVAPKDPNVYYKIYYQYEPLWKLLSKEASLKIRKTNYVRIFDEARRKVRAWEKTHVQ
jgi:predicted TIM-barrel fold metal-dependent hydrolase